MAVKREYTPSEVLSILKQSNNRVSPYNGSPGHCLSMHVLISDDGLIDRHGGPGGAVPVKKSTAFKNFKTASGSTAMSSDMAFVVAHVLNSSDGQNALGALDAGTYRRVSIVGAAPSKILGDSKLAQIGVRQSERVGSPNAFNNAPTKANGVTHNMNNDVKISGGGKNIWVLVDKIDADHIHVHTCSPCDPGDPQRPIGWSGLA